MSEDDDFSGSWRRFRVAERSGNYTGAVGWLFSPRKASRVRRDNRDARRLVSSASIGLLMHGKDGETIHYTLFVNACC